MHYLVKFQKGPAGVADWCAQTGRTAKTYAQLPGVALLDLTEEERAQLIKAAVVEYLEEDGLLICNAVAAASPPAPVLPKHLQQIFAVRDATAKGVRVAVLDTGVDSKAPGLQLAAAMSFVETEPSAEDALWHGTWVAGLVGADAEELGVVGVAKKAELYSAKMMDRTGVGRFSEALAALEWAIEQQVDIVLMAFGSATASAALTELLSKADQLGILLVAAAGNDGQEGVNFPACLPFVLGVGAAEDSGAAAKFSNRGDGLDLLAPGVAVPSLYLFGNVFIQSGTSASAALAAGVAALLKSGNPKLCGQELRDLLLAGSIPPSGDGESSEIGLLNAHTALHQAEKYKRAAVSPLAMEPKAMRVQTTQVGQRETGCLQASDHQHVYRLQSDRSMAVEITLKAPSACEYEFYVYAEGQGLIGVGRPAGKIKRFLLNANAKTVYSIQVFGYGGDCQAAEPYALGTRPLVAEESAARIFQCAAELEELVPGSIRRAELYAEFDVNEYKVTLEKGQALEIDLSNVPPHCRYTMELYDAEGVFVAQARPLANRMQVLTYDAVQGGVYRLKVFSRQGFDANHPYALHLDVYRALNGTVSGSVTLPAADGPYLLGTGGLTVAGDAVLTVEAGTVFSLRSPARLQVQDGGTLILAGTRERPIQMLGARTVAGAGIDSLQEIEWNPERSQVRWGYVHLQYDPVQPTTGPERTEAGGAEREIAPSERPEAAKRWYLPASPYRLALFEPLKLKKVDLYFGMDVATFIQWEVDSRRISDERMVAGAVNYWEFVNGHFMRDLAEAKRLYDQRQTSSSIRVQRMIDYLQQGVDWVEQHGCLTVTKLWHLLNGTQAKALYHHLKTLSIAFWWSHNSSIVAWDKRARELGLEAEEEFYERAFLHGVVLRCDFTTDLPFNLPVYGNNIPPIGWLGLFLTRGAFRYPAEYPAKKPPAIPSALLDYEGQTTLEVLKAYCRFLLQKGSNAVYTWWLPTPADLELQRRGQAAALPLAAPDQDWKREYLEPQLKTLEEITRKYVRDGFSKKETWIPVNAERE